jgi:outer membrane murein-binding lipoprotein Lpp
MRTWGCLGIIIIRNATVKTKFTLLIAVLVLSGCASMSKSLQQASGVGVLSTSQSEFDGSRNVKMSPAWVAKAGGGIAPFKVGVAWNDKTPDVAALLVELVSLGGGFSTISNLEMNLDGRLVELVPSEVVTDHQYDQLTGSTCNQFGCTSGLSMQTSSKVFIVKVADIKAILHSASAKIRTLGGREERIGDLKAPSTGSLTFVEVLPDLVAEIERQ